MDPDTQAWRESVVGSLSSIQEQLKRMASDRESEKRNLLRITDELWKETRRLDDRISDEVSELRTEDKEISRKLNMGVGIVGTIQVIGMFIIGLHEFFRRP